MFSRLIDRLISSISPGRWLKVVLQITETVSRENPVYPRSWTATPTVNAVKTALQVIGRKSESEKILDAIIVPKCSGNMLAKKIKSKSGPRWGATIQNNLSYHDE
jgi:hypothetical protein